MLFSPIITPPTSELTKDGNIAIVQHCYLARRPIPVYVNFDPVTMCKIDTAVPQWNSQHLDSPSEGFCLSRTSALVLGRSLLGKTLCHYLDGGCPLQGLLQLGLCYGVLPSLQCCRLRKSCYLSKSCFSASDSDFPAVLAFCFSSSDQCSHIFNEISVSNKNIIFLKIKQISQKLVKNLY